MHDRTTEGGDSSSIAVPALTLITDNRGLESLLTKALAAPVVAVDTESNSLFAYFHRVCLIQVSLPEADYVVDPLALDASPLGRLFASAQTQKVFHAAENDILGLKRDFGFTFANVFDTMLTARILGWRQVGLAAILAERFGVQLDKRLQRADWGRRPLHRDQLAYAQMDTHYLLPLHAYQLKELEQRGRAEEARESFNRLTTLEWIEKPFDTEGFWRINGARDLPPVGQAVLRELYLFREGEAQRLNRPPFKLFGEELMVAISREQPDSLDALRRMRGLTSHQMRSYGSGILAAVARGVQAPPPKPPKRAVNGDSRPDVDTLARYEALRLWRSERARERGVDPDVVLTNNALMAIARLAPISPESLAATKTMGPAKLEEYGKSILEVLRRVNGDTALPPA